MNDGSAAGAPIASVTAKPVGPDRIEADYRIRGDAAHARAIATLIAHEHTVELPGDLLNPFLADEIVARVTDVVVEGAHVRVTLSYAADLAAGGLPGLVAMLMGNASFFAGVTLADIRLPPALLDRFAGPRLGVGGIRDALRAPGRPLCGSALKPMGASPAELARIAGMMVRGGIDILKDDDGLTDQPMARFADRVRACAVEVADAAVASGQPAIYAPNVTGPLDTLLDRAFLAQEAGAGAVEVIYGVMGYDAIRLLVDAPGFRLPVVGHSAWSGALVRGPDPVVDAGLAFGLLPRLAGADISALPGFLGRFGLTQDECARVRTAAGAPLGALGSPFMMVGGGLGFDTIARTLQVCGPATILLISTALLRHPGGLEDACRHLRAIADAWDPAA